MKYRLSKICKSRLSFENAGGRITIFAALVLYYAVFFISLSFFDINLMKLQGIPVAFPCFADLRSITSAQDSIRQGYDPLINNPYDPWGRVTPYPCIWHLLVKLNVTQNHTFPIGIILSVVFYLCVITLLIPKIDKHITILWVFLILSPAVTLAVERGNNDLIVFILVCLSLLGFKSNRKLPNLLSYLIILLAAVLKIYPVFAFASFFKEKGRIFLTLSTFFGLAFLLYIAFTFNDLLLIGKATRTGPMFAYGNMVIFDYFQRYILGKMLNIQELPDRNVWRICAWFFIFLFVTLVFLRVRKKNNYTLYHDSSYITSFRIGAAIFVGTFLLGSNCDYRLIFLLFTIPQLIQWELEDKKSLASKALWFILISLWSISWLRIIKLPYRLGIILDEAFNWMLFVTLSYLLVISMPDWFKKLFTKVNKMGRFCEALNRLLIWMRQNEYL